MANFTTSFRVRSRFNSKMNYISHWISSCGWSTFGIRVATALVVADLRTQPFGKCHKTASAPPRRNFTSRSCCHVSVLSVHSWQHAGTLTVASHSWATWHDDVRRASCCQFSTFFFSIRNRKMCQRSSHIKYSLIFISDYSFFILLALVRFDGIRFFLHFFPHSSIRGTNSIGERKFYSRRNER